MRTAMIATWLALFAACGEIDAGGPSNDAGADEDPLRVGEDPVKGSFDDLHRRIITPRCSGTPGLCHNGQFEPNLSTPSLAYAYLVNRPSIEKPTRRRVQPGQPEASVLIDKLRGRNVRTLMPLGAEPLDEADIAALEAWISAGALRRPGAEAAPVLNEPPRPAEIGIYQDDVRLDVGATTTIHVGDTITFRHSVDDFETKDEDIQNGFLVLFTARGAIVLNPSNAASPQLALTQRDSSGPRGAGDILNFHFTWKVPAQIELYDDESKKRTPASATGQTFFPVVIYRDNQIGGIPAFRIDDRPVVIE